jgi:hypothetical protein
LVVYQNTTYNYRISYPPGGSLVINTPILQKIALPFDPGTSLAEKYAQIDVITSPVVCASPLGTASLSQNMTINGVPFLKQIGAQDAAGSTYTWMVFSTQKGTTCVSVGFVLRSLNPGPLPTPTAPPYNAVTESLIFDQMIATFGWLTP